MPDSCSFCCFLVLCVFGLVGVVWSGLFGSLIGRVRSGVTPFLRRVRTASGAVAVQIVEKVGRTNRVVEHVGTAHGAVELAALVQVANDHLHPDQGALDVFATGSTRTAVIEAKRSRWMWEVLETTYADLSFDVLVDKAFKQLVLARIVEPTSTADTIRVFEDLGVAHASLRTLFNALGRASRMTTEVGWRGRVWLTWPVVGICPSCSMTSPPCISRPRRRRSFPRSGLLKVWLTVFLLIFRPRGTRLVL